jgi:hypothetical protein
VTTSDLNVATDRRSEIDFYDKYTISFSNLNKSGDSKAFVTTVVATEKMWLNTTDLDLFD